MSTHIECKTREEAVRKATARLATYLLEVQITFELSHIETGDVLSQIVINEIDAHSARISNETLSS